MTDSLTQDAPTGADVNEQALASPENEPDQSQLAGVDAPDADADEKALARERGWIEQDAYKGDPNKYRDFKTFNRVYETRTLPKKLRDEIREKDGVLDAMRAEMAELRKFQQEHIEARQSVQEESLLAEQADAAERGDHRRVAEITREIVKIAVQKGTPAPQQAPQVDAGTKRILDDFLEENPVFGDAKMQKLLQREAYLLGLEQAQTHPSQRIKGRAFLDEARANLELARPDLFRPAPRRPAMAEMNGTPAPRTTAGRTWADLKPEYRQSLDAFIAGETHYTKMGTEKARARMLAQADDSYFRSNR